MNGVYEPYRVGEYGVRPRLTEQHKNLLIIDSKPPIARLGRTLFMFRSICIALMLVAFMSFYGISRFKVCQYKVEFLLITVIVILKELYTPIFRALRGVKN